MNLDDLKRAYPPLSEEGRAAMMRTVHRIEEEAPVKKRLSLGLALAIALTLLLAGTAAALVMRASVRTYLEPKFADKVVDINDEYANPWFRLTITDAIFDGIRNRFAVNMEALAGREDEVFVFPVMSATGADGQKLRTDFESGYEFFDGVWMPERSFEYAQPQPGQYGVDAMLVNEDYEPRASTGQDVTWRLDFHVLKPNWPVVVHKEGFDPNEMTHEAYMAQFKEAVKDRKILLTSGDTVVEWGSQLPTPQGMTQEEYFRLPQWEQLVRSGAFDEVERFSRTFDMVAKDSLKQAEPQIITREGMTLHLEAVQASFMSLWVDIQLETKGLQAPVPYDEMQLEARVEDTVLQMVSFGSSGELPNSGLLRLRGEYSLAGVEGVPGGVTLVPVWVRYPDVAKGETQSTRYVDEEKAFVVKLH